VVGPPVTMADLVRLRSARILHTPEIWRIPFALALARAPAPLPYPDGIVPADG
jgi:hypothetical protein